jgi:hypothetical protein
MRCRLPLFFPAMEFSGVPFALSRALLARQVVNQAGMLRFRDAAYPSINYGRSDGEARFKLLCGFSFASHNAVCDRERSAEVKAGRDSSSRKRERLAVVEGCSHYIRNEPWVVCQFDPRNRDNAH